MSGQNNKKKQQIWQNLITISTIINLVLFSAPVSGQEVEGNVFPFHLEYDRIARLLLVNFEADPDTVYVGFEPQVLPIDDGNEAHLIIAWRKDGYVDVYHQTILSPDATKYNITGKGLANLVPSNIDTAEFVLTTTGLKVNYTFKDIYDRPVKISISENGHTRRRPFSLLAPMGVAAASPKALPCLFLHDFYFVRRKNTQFKISISGNTHRPDKLPFPIDGKRMFFTRYCMNPVIATFLPSADIQLNPIGNPNLNKNEYLLDEENNLKTINWYDDNYNISISLEQPMPDIHTLIESRKHYTSKFKLFGDKSAGSINGQITIQPVADSLQLYLHPDKGWKPRPDRLSLFLLYRVAGVFRNWPTYYHWNATVTESDNGALILQSNWINQSKK